jgi:hypothetical protein
MTERIEFEELMITDPITKRKWDAVAVIRNSHQVALLPEADRLRRALELPLEEIEHIVDNFTRIMNRQPTPDESEFWKAVFDFKRGQSQR